MDEKIVLKSVELYLENEHFINVSTITIHPDGNID